MRPALIALPLAFLGCSYLSPEVRVDNERDLSRFHRVALLRFEEDRGGPAASRELENRLKGLKFDTMLLKEAGSPGARVNVQKIQEETLVDAVVLGALEPRASPPGWSKMTLVVLDADTGQEVLRRATKGLKGYASIAEAADEAKAWFLDQMSLGDLGTAGAE